MIPAASVMTRGCVSADRASSGEHQKAHAHERSNSNLRVFNKGTGTGKSMFITSMVVDCLGGGYRDQDGFVSPASPAMRLDQTGDGQGKSLYHNRQNAAGYIEPGLPCQWVSAGGSMDNVGLIVARPGTARFLEISSRPRLWVFYPQ
jgi:hypothetical protein